MRSLCFLCIGKAYLNMNLQYGCAHNFSCANKNLFRTILLYFKSLSDQSIYLRPISPNNSFLLPRSASDKFTTRSKEYIGKIIFSQKGFFVKSITQQASFQKSTTKLYSRLYHALQTLVFFQNLFLDLDLDGSSARFPKSSSKDLIGTKFPSTYLCLNLTSLWSVKWPNPINF